MSAPRFRRVAVVGLGLLGGSVAAAARARRVAECVVGVTRSRDVAAAARRQGMVDEVTLDPGAGAAGAELLVLATPVAAMGEALRRAAPGLESGALVTDVGSVKGTLADTLPGLLPAGVTYVGAHPMAGSHRSGLAHARDDLFEGAVCVLTPAAGADDEAVARVAAFWEALGARVLRRSATAHDEEVAWVSHLPHALAFAFARALEAAPEGAAALRASGFRDFTRIAGSDPELWADILVQNRKALEFPLAAAGRRLAELAALVEAGDAGAVHRFLASARDQLARGADDARSGGESPEIKAARAAAAKE